VAEPKRTSSPTPIARTQPASDQRMRKDRTASTPSGSPLTSGPKRTIAMAAIAHAPMTAPSATEQQLEQAAPSPQPVDAVHRDHAHARGRRELPQGEQETAREPPPLPLADHLLHRVVDQPVSRLRGRLLELRRHVAAPDLLERSRKPIRASRNSRSGTSARITRKAMAPAKFTSPLRRKESTTSVASSRTASPPTTHVTPSSKTPHFSATSWDQAPEASGCVCSLDRQHTA
jgi:hypothetical protein